MRRLRAAASEFPSRGFTERCANLAQFSFLRFVTFEPVWWTRDAVGVRALAPDRCRAAAAMFEGRCLVESARIR